MIRGCSKRVVYLKNTDSTLFDEAYFVLSREQKSTKLGEREMLREAERIVRESSSEEQVCGTVKGKRGRLWFFAGGLCATLLYTVIGVVLYLLGAWGA